MSRFNNDQTKQPEVKSSLFEKARNFFMGKSSAAPGSQDADKQAVAETRKPLEDLKGALAKIDLDLLYKERDPYAVSDEDWDKFDASIKRFRKRADDIIAAKAVDFNGDGVFEVMRSVAYLIVPAFKNGDFCTVDDAMETLDYGFFVVQAPLKPDEKLDDRTHRLEQLCAMTNASDQIRKLKHNIDVITDETNKLILELNEEEITYNNKVADPQYAQAVEQIDNGVDKTEWTEKTKELSEFLTKLTLKDNAIEQYSANLSKDKLSLPIYESQYNQLKTLLKLVKAEMSEKDIITADNLIKSIITLTAERLERSEDIFNNTFENRIQAVKGLGPGSAYTVVADKSGSHVKEMQRRKLEEAQAAEAAAQKKIERDRAMKEEMDRKLKEEQERKNDSVNYNTNTTTNKNEKKLYV